MKICSVAGCSLLNLTNVRKTHRDAVDGLVSVSCTPLSDKKPILVDTVIYYNIGAPWFLRMGTSAVVAN